MAVAGRRCAAGQNGFSRLRARRARATLPTEVSSADPSVLSEQLSIAISERQNGRITPAIPEQKQERLGSQGRAMG
jgi:hypothetical protein